MKRLIASALLLLACSAGSWAQSFTSLSSHPVQQLEDRLLYHPLRDGESWSQLPWHIRVEDVCLNARDGQRIHAWWFRQPQSSGAVLLCHGNAGNLSHCSGRVLKLQKALGQSVLVFDYPGYGKSSGTPSEDGCYAAAHAALDWLATAQQIPTRQVTVYGESLGGGVATELAVSRPVRAVVLVRTFTSVPDIARTNVWTSSAARLVHNRFDNLSRIRQCTAPIFIAHGNRDTLIPMSQAAQLFEAAPLAKRSYLLRNCGHNDDLPADFYVALAEFLQHPPVDPMAK